MKCRIGQPMCQNEGQHLRYETGQRLIANFVDYSMELAGDIRLI